MKARFINCFVSLIFVLLVVSTVEAAASVPEWSANTGAVDTNGVIGLTWTRTVKAEEAPTLFYQIHENYAAEETVIHQLESTAVRLQRQRPGLYQFKIISCALTKTGDIECGDASAVLEVTITNAVAKKVQRPVQGKREKASGVGIKAGQFVPGMYQSSINEYSGWSIFSASSLRYGSSPLQFGRAFEKVAYWASFRLINGIWQPVWLRAQLVSVKGNVYAGDLVYITNPSFVEKLGENICGGTDLGHQPCATVIGRVEIDVTDADAPLLRWSSQVADFYADPRSVGQLVEESLSSRKVGSKNLDPLEYGLWQEAGNAVDGLTLIHWSEPNMDANLLLFYDQEQAGHPAWSLGQVKSNKRVDNRKVQVCARMVKQGIPADSGIAKIGELSQSGFMEGNCEAVEGKAFKPNFKRIFVAAPAGEMSARAEVEIHISGDKSRKIKLGLEGENHTIQLLKTVGLHDIRYSHLNRCDLAQKACEFSVMWFSNGDYPEATVYLQNLTTNKSSLIVTRQPNGSDQRIEIDQPGAYQLILKSSNKKKSTVLAQSKIFHVRAPQQTSNASLLSTTGLKQKKAAATNTQEIYYDPISSYATNGWVKNPAGTDQVRLIPEYSFYGRFEIGTIHVNYSGGVYYQPYSVLVTVLALAHGRGVVVHLTMLI